MSSAQESDNRQRGDMNASGTDPSGNPPTTNPSATDQNDPQALPSPSRAGRPHLSANEPAFGPRSQATFANEESNRPPGESPLSPATADRIFPIRSVVTVDPNPTPSQRLESPQQAAGYFPPGRRTSMSPAEPSQQQSRNVSNSSNVPDRSRAMSPREPNETRRGSRKSSVTSTNPEEATSQGLGGISGAPQYLNDIMADGESLEESRSRPGSVRPVSQRAASVKSATGSIDEGGPLMTARFKHVVSEGGHAIITGRDGETLQRCEDEPIHIPGAVQGFGLLIALEEQQEGKLVVRVVSENSKRLIGYTPKQLFALESFTDILTEDQADNLLDHVDFIRDEDADVVTNGPEVFTLSVRQPGRRSQKFWCAMHINDRNSNLIICEFELEDDLVNPLVPPNDATPEPPEDTLDSRPTAEEYQESTQNSSKPLRVLRSARKRKGEAAAMEVFNIMSQVQEQLAAAPDLEKFLKILVGVVKELTGFHRVMIYQFDQSFNGRVVTELVDPRATKDLYKGLNFPASDIPKQARDLYKINKVRMLYDRDQETARLVCRTMEDLETPLDLTHSYLRAMSPIHLKYLANMAVRSSMSISINAFDELWGLIACHSYGSKGMRVSFPIRKMCRLVGDSASRNIERLSYASRLQARKLINTVPTQSNPSGYIIASSEDLLKLFDADFGLLSIRDETKILGRLEQSQEALAMLEYLRMRQITNVMTSQDIKQDFPDLRYPPGFQVIAGLLLVPLSAGGQDFIVFFRKGQLREVKWAGNPYEKFIKEGTEGYLEPRKSFRTWSEMVVGKCRDWSEEEIETAAVLCLVYGKFIEVWRQKEAALQNSQLTRLLLANSAHEVRTPLNAIINYLEIALEGTLDQETRENLAKSHSASKSLIYVINDLLDLTKTEEGGELVKDEIFELRATLAEATDMFSGDARRKGITYDVSAQPGLPTTVIGDQRRVRQAISNITANAIQNTSQGGVQVVMYLVSRDDSRCEVELSVADTGVGMSSKKLDQLFRELEQVQTEAEDVQDVDLISTMPKPLPSEGGKKGEDRCLGLGLAVVARIVRNMNGQVRLKSEEGQGSRFVIQFPFDLPDSEPKQMSLEQVSSVGSVTPHADIPSPPPPGPQGEEVTLIERGSGNRWPSTDLRRNEMSRKNSAESVNSKHSLNSMNSVRSALSNVSFSSQRSGKSEADRLIEAIQEPRRVEGHGPQRSGSTRRSIAGSSGPTPTGSRPRLEKRHTTTAVEPVAVDAQSQDSATSDRPKSIDFAPLEVSTGGHLPRPGETAVMDQGTPLRPVRVPDGLIVDAKTGGYTSSSSISAAAAASQQPQSQPVPDDLQSLPSEPGFTPNPGSAEQMRVLVAEDDPVNSRIIKKRLEKLGHEVVLTVNGEDCASTYCDRSDVFDIILMDMQMPIVDGLTSTKMIRSHEKSQTPSISSTTPYLSPRASFNGRIPIIAVSASLIERDRQTYIDAGFDGWILKPISFHRMTDIMTGIVNDSVRRDNLYCPGAWEHGGWFSEAKVAPTADTHPSGDAPVHAPGTTAASGKVPEGVRRAAESDDLSFKEDEGSVQTIEQTRLMESQEAQQQQRQQQERPPALISKASSMPETVPCAGDFGFRNQDDEEKPTIAVEQTERVSSPDAIPEAVPPASDPPASAGDDGS